MGTKSTPKEPPNQSLQPAIPMQGLQREAQQPGYCDEAQQHASSPQEGISEPIAEGDRAIQLSSLREGVSRSPREIHTSHGDRSVQEEGSESSSQEVQPGKDDEAELVESSAHSGDGETQLPTSSTASQEGSPHLLEARAISETNPTGEAARSLEGPSTLVDHSSTPQKLGPGTWSSISQEEPEIGNDKEWEISPSRLPAVPEEDSPKSDKGISPTTPIKSSTLRGLAQEDGGYVPTEQQSRSLANEKKYIRDSGIQSSGGSQEQSFTDDVLARRSWPPVDENAQTVDLGRKKRTKQKESAYAQITPINIAKAATGLGLAGGSLSNTSTLPLSASPLGTPRHLSGTHRSVSERINTPDIFDRRGTPDSGISAKSRPVSVLSNRSYISSHTPPLRRSDRRVSGDLRSLSQMDLSQPSTDHRTAKVSAAAVDDSGSSSDRSAVTTTAKRHSLGATTRERDNIYAQSTANESRPRLTSEEMAQAEVYVGLPPPALFPAFSTTLSPAFDNDTNIVALLVLGLLLILTIGRLW